MDALPACERHALEQVLEFIKIQSGEQNVSKALGATLLAVDQSIYFFNEESMVPVARRLLKRLCDIIDLFKQPRSLIYIDGQPEMDIFTASESDFLGFFAITEQGQRIESTGSLDSWQYHFLLNDLKHPATRETVVAMGTIEMAEEPFCFDDIFAKQHAAFTVDTTVLRASLNAVLVLDMPAYEYEDVVDFEELYGIPEERSYRALLDFEMEEDDIQSVWESWQAEWSDPAWPVQWPHMLDNID